MNRNLIIVLAGGFLIAVLVAVMVQASLKGGKKEKVAVKEEPRVEILVAAKNLGIGAELKEDSVKWQEWPKNAVFEGAIVKEGDKKASEAVKGKLKRGLSVGEPLLKSALVGESDNNFVAASLGEGMRAVAVDVKASTIAGGLLKPGDYVDVILIYKSKIQYNGSNPLVRAMIELNHDRYSAETILQNVRVIALGQTYKTDEEGKKGGGKAKTITLEVDMRGAETLTLAKEMGKLSLTLRKLGDEEIYPRKYEVITDERLTHIMDEIYGKMAEIENNSGQNGNIVRIYNSYSLEQVPIVP